MSFKTFIVRISKEEEKALLCDMIDIQEWLDNIVHEKARRCMDMIITAALDDTTHTILLPNEKQDAVNALYDAGIIIDTVKHIPDELRDTIVDQARVKSAAAKMAELGLLP